MNGALEFIPVTQSWATNGAGIRPDTAASYDRLMGGQAARRRTAKLGRTPPEKVKLALRREVGYGCPVRDCASPYLEYHHFDPAWAIEHHHRPRA